MNDLNAMLDATKPALALPWLVGYGVSEEGDRVELQCTLPPIETSSAYDAETLASADDAIAAWQTLLLATWVRSSEQHLRMMRQVLKMVRSRPRPEAGTPEAILYELIGHYFGTSTAVNAAILWFLDQTVSEAAAKREAAATRGDVSEPSADRSTPIPPAPTSEPPADTVTASAPASDAPGIKTDPEILTGEATPSVSIPESTHVTETEATMPAPAPLYDAPIAG